MNKINESQLHCSGSTNLLHPEDVSFVLLHFLITKRDVFSPYSFKYELPRQVLGRELNNTGDDATSGISLGSHLMLIPGGGVDHASNV